MMQSNKPVLLKLYCAKESLRDLTEGRLWFSLCRVALSLASSPDAKAAGTWTTLRGKGQEQYFFTCKLPGPTAAASPESLLARQLLRPHPRLSKNEA